MSHPAIGFIGLGTMGGAMCRHVIEAGFPVTVWGPIAGPCDQASGSRCQLGAISGGAGKVVRHRCVMRFQ